jgi:diguanylate cyclase (GGDEF)-like protein
LEEEERLGKWEDWDRSLNRDMQLKRSIATPGGYDDVQVELTGLTFNNLLPTILIGSAGFLAATGLLAYVYRDLILWAIVGLGVLACAARLGIAFMHGRIPEDVAITAEDAARWESLYSVTTLAYVSVFALATFRVFWSHDMAGDLLCSVGCVSVCAGLAARPGLQPLKLKISGLIPIAALIVSAVIFGPLLVKAAGLMAALYAVTFIQTADRNFDRVVEQFRAKRTMLMNSQLDPLTSLPNRKYMRARLAELCKTNESFAALFLDLDDFKIVNDTMGHGAGDDLLLQVTARLKAMMRESDLLARVGGDEFAILQTPAKSKREVVALAERINQQIAAPYQIHGQKAVIGVSVGVRLALGGMHEPDDVLHRADTALYNVKAAGKGGYTIALD